MVSFIFSFSNFVFQHKHLYVLSWPFQRIQWSRSYFLASFSLRLLSCPPKTFCSKEILPNLLSNQLAAEPSPPLAKKIDHLKFLMQI